MKRVSKAWAVLLILCMCIGMTTACAGRAGSSKNEDSQIKTGQSSEAVGKVAETTTQADAKITLSEDQSKNSRQTADEQQNTDRSKAEASEVSTEVKSDTNKTANTAKSQSGKKADSSLTVGNSDNNSNKKTNTYKGEQTSANESSDEEASTAADDNEDYMSGSISGLAGGTSTSASVSTLDMTGYSLVWSDEFEGNTLDTGSWNVETHDPGWVNDELQAYVNSDANISVADGVLKITPVKSTDESGQVTYTSGRISSQNKQTFTYGVFEARVKVPEGQGFLPAFWLMANDENIYGQWPRCGEIDCMEVMGQDTSKVYGTIHYGNPHSESQGTKTIDGSFSEDYHVFSVEWNPGSIKWYVDGVLYHEEDDWYSTTVGQGTKAYPAPFDQPFYIILNLAVGGSWVGNVNDATFDANNDYYVDYVRVYQKDSYDENVTKPVKTVTLRDPDATGNYIVNGDFEVNEALDDDTDWVFMTANSGSGSAAIANGQMTVDTSEAGSVDYSIQLVQAGLPLEKGATYKVSFDAYADSDRSMKVDIKAPDKGYQTYMNTMNVSLTATAQNYSQTFKMTGDTDANARLEYNMGAAGSVAGIHIDNVRIEKIQDADPNETEVKTVLSDGNYVYNASFDEGDGHLGYWDISDSFAVSVTDFADSRRAKVTVGEGCTVTLSQDDLALVPGDYAMSVSLESADGGDVSFAVGGLSFTLTPDGNKKTYTKKLTGVSDNDIAITFSTPGTYYIDDVIITEDALIKNGSFNAGLTGYDNYVDGSASATMVVDSLNEANALDITIDNSGDQAWKIQVKQENVELIKDQCYKLSFDIKSSIDRSYQYSIQRNGNIHNDDWTTYVQVDDRLSAYNENGDYTHVEKYFKMTCDTDEASVFNIALGGGNITDSHRVCVDNITLEKVDESDMPSAGGNGSGSLLSNSDFANGMSDWTETIANWGGDYVADASSSVDNGAITYVIQNPGTEDWHVQLKQSGLNLESGKTYVVSYDVVSSVARSIKSGVQSPSYTWFGGSDPTLNANESQTVSFEFTMSEDSEGVFYISMGKCGDDTPGGTITISNISMTEKSQ